MVRHRFCVKLQTLSTLHFHQPPSNYYYKSISISPDPPLACLQEEIYISMSTIFNHSMKIFSKFYLPFVPPIPFILDANYFLLSPIPLSEYRGGSAPDISLTRPITYINIIFILSSHLYFILFWKNMTVLTLLALFS